MIQLHL